MVRKFVGVAVSAAAIAAGLIWGLPVRAAQPADGENTKKVQVRVNPEVIALDHFDSTPRPLREMKLIPPDFKDRREQSAPLRWRHSTAPSPALQSLRDLAEQRTFGPLPMVGT